MAQSPFLCYYFRRMDTKGLSLQEILDLVEARLFTEIHESVLSERRAERAFASDLMSEVLTLLTDDLLLITGLNNVQAVRTAEMGDIGAILLVRDKKPGGQMVELAADRDVVLIGSNYSMYRASGVLYKAGLDYVF